MIFSKVCEDAVTYRDAYGYSCAFWNERCSRYDPPIAEINRHVVYTFGQIKEVHNVYTLGPGKNGSGKGAPALQENVPVLLGR